MKNILAPNSEGSTLPMPEWTKVFEPLIGRERWVFIRTHQGEQLHGTFHGIANPSGASTADMLCLRLMTSHGLKLIQWSAIARCRFSRTQRPRIPEIVNSPRELSA